MAIALPLIVELFHSLDRAVQWLSGGTPGSAHADRSARDGRGHREGRDTRGGQGASGAQRLCLPTCTPASGSRQWGGPLRLHPARRIYRPLHTPH